LNFIHDFSNGRRNGIDIRRTDQVETTVYCIEGRFSYLSIFAPVIGSLLDKFSPTTALLLESLCDEARSVGKHATFVESRISLLADGDHAQDEPIESGVSER
jgi:hypothetical protein